MMGNQYPPERIVENIRTIREKLERAAHTAGRMPEEVRLMAVTKTVPAQLVNVAAAENIFLFGENRAQELLERAGDYAFGPQSIHFIGSLQTNKVRQIVGKVSCIQSVNSLHLAQEIQRRALEAGKTMEVLVEVNIGAEESKTGMKESETVALLDKMAALSALKVRGLMCIPPIGQNSLETERYFEQMYKLFVDIKHKKLDNINMDILSMGMSGDYELAVKHGSTLVRIGTGIFGHRNNQ